MVVVYDILDFDFDKAKNGALCAIITSAYLASGSLVTIVSNNTSFIGVGICEIKSNDRVSLVIDGTEYIFNRLGKPVNKNAELYCAKLVQLSSGTAGFTRANEDEEEEESESRIAYKKAIIVSVLPEIIARAERKSSQMSDSEMLYYCQQAYRWAKNMATVYCPEPPATQESEGGQTIGRT